MFTIKVKQSRPPVKGDGLMVTSLIISYKTYSFLDIQKIQYLCRFQGLWLDKMSEGSSLDFFV